MTRLAKSRHAEAALERILVALEAELVQASDEEIVEAARDLGMNLEMKGSAAFIGLKYPGPSDTRAFFEWFFGPDAPDAPALGESRGAPALERREGGSAAAPRNEERDED